MDGSGSGTILNPRRVLVRTLAIFGLLFSLTGCSAVPSAPSDAVTPIASASTEAAPTRPSTTTPGASASPALLESTTEPATEAPEGAILLEMVGPPPVFNPRDVTATAGDVTFYLENNSPAGMSHGRHNLAIGPTQDAPIAKSGIVDGGARAVFTIKDLPTGRYQIWCSLYEHNVLGQVGTLIVE